MSKITNSSLIQEIKDTMLDSGFNLTNKQIKEYLKENPMIECDTLEREKIADYLALKITGMNFPTYRDSEEYQEIFFKLLTENSEKFGYKLN